MVGTTAKTSRRTPLRGEIDVVGAGDAMTANLAAALNVRESRTPRPGGRILRTTIRRPCRFAGKSRGQDLG